MSDNTNQKTTTQEPREEPQPPTREELLGMEDDADAPESDVSPEEEQAREKGWVPYDEWEGEEEQWVDAGEFLRREPFFKAIHNLKREVKQLQEAQRYTHQHYQELMTKQKEKLMAELKEQRRAAFEEGDYEKLEQVEEDMNQLSSQYDQQAAGQQVASPQQAPPEFLEWAQKNPWYQTNPDLYQEANTKAALIANSNPNMTYPDLLEAVTKEIKKEHPEIFGRKKAASRVNEPTRTTGGKKSKGLSINDLPPAERRIAKTMIRNGSITEEKFVKQYQERFGS